MSRHSGLLYYFDLLGMDPDSFLVHYRLGQSAGVGIANETRFSGLSGIWNVSSTGDFRNNYVRIQSGSALNVEQWTHMFVSDRRSSSSCVVFDSITSGSRVSGYRIGFNDNNELYVEGYSEYGPISVTSDLPSRQKNVYAVAKSANNVSFYSYDYHNNKVDSSSHALSTAYIPSSNSGTIGSGLNYGGLFVTGNYSGNISDYLIFSDALTPISFKYLSSGLASDMTLTPGSVTTYSGIQITGYTTGITGNTGIIRYDTVITGSGLDPFGTGEYAFKWGPSGITGYFTSGQLITPRTGYVYRYETGAGTSGVSLNNSFISGMYHSEISILRPIDNNDYVVTNVNLGSSLNRNLSAVYDDVQGEFVLPDLEDENKIEVFRNGVLQTATGYTITGNNYVSGYSLSGDFRLDSYIVDSSRVFTADDAVSYDRLTTQPVSVLSLASTGLKSGAQIGLYSSFSEVYLNGVLLNTGIDYTVGSTGQIDIITDRLSGVTGRITSWPMESGDSFRQGYSGLSGTFYKGSQKVWMNGVRLNQNIQYVENCGLDLLYASGIFGSTVSIFNNEENYYE